MRTWHRSDFEFTCGYCGTRMPAGSPLFSVTLTSVKHPRVRCASCAWEPLPAVLPIGVPIPVLPTYVDEDGIERPGHAPMTPLRDALSDWKQKASGK